MNWWGKFRLETGQMSRLEVGSFSLHIYREEHQWRVAWDNTGDALSESCSVERARTPEDAREGMRQARFGAGDRDDRIEIRPLLADRPFVAKPETGLCILPGEAVTLYITTAVNVGLYLHEAARPQLDFPSLRARDTWFGRDTTEGQLCYASRTWAHMNRAQFRPWPHRALTTVIIRNRASTPLDLARISLPVPNFSLYVDGEGYLRTSSLLLKRDDDHELAHARLMEPGASEQWTLVTPPREPLRNRWLRAFAGVF